VLRNIQLSIPAGSLTVIRGKSGSGKTTLLNVIGGLDSIDSGQVEVAGIALEKLKPAELTRYRAEKAGFIFQFHNLIPTLNVLENVLSGLEAMRPLRPGDEQQARFYLNAVGLGSMEGKFPTRLSGGQQQRVAIARALIKEPLLILADEPTGSLDEDSGQAVIDLLRRLQADKNITVIIVTHNPEWAQYADQLFEMRGGGLHDMQTQSTLNAA
jgi:putative ABC transport system ATP-binding protein